jgi:fatty-acyl-CoA synthase
VNDLYRQSFLAVVVAPPGQRVDVDELIALVKDRKGSHHAPKSVDVVESIPMSPLGKPDKKALRARYWADSDRLIH